MVLIAQELRTVEESRKPFSFKYTVLESHTPPANTFHLTFDHTATL